MTSTELPPELQPLLDLATTLGAVGVEPVARPGPCRVWRLGGESPLWLKRFASTRSFAQERGALRDWGLERVPRVLGEGPSALLLSHVDGEAPLTLEAWRAAGRFLAAMQAGSGPDEDPLPLDEALARRFQAWRALAEGRLEAEVLRSAEEVFDPSLFAGERRVRCHRDFQPRNWRWGPGGFGLIDFEHARYDHPLQDLVRVLDHVDVADPRWEALLEGRGPLAAGDRARLRSLRALDSLGADKAPGDGGG